MLLLKRKWPACSSVLEQVGGIGELQVQCIDMPIYSSLLAADSPAKLVQGCGCVAVCCHVYVYN